MWSYILGISVFSGSIFGLFKLGKHLSSEALKQSLDELERIVDKTDEIEELIKEHKQLIDEFSGKIKVK